MNIQDQEFFDKIDEVAIDKFVLRCLVCCSHFDANFNNGYNTHFSSKCNRVIPECPICHSAADNIIENEESSLDNENEV